MLPEELTTEERAEIADRLAKKVADRRLESVATLFLEMNKPIAFIGGQALLVAAPIFGTIFGYDDMQRLALFFQSADNIELLLQRIEALARERSQQRGVGEGAKG